MRCLSVDHCHSLLMAMLRRSLGMAVLRANAQLLARRFQNVGYARPAREISEYKRSLCGDAETEPARTTDLAVGRGIEPPPARGCFSPHTL